MKRQTITLEITYDETYADPPMRWDWAELLGISPNENVKIVDVTRIEDAPETTTNEDEEEAN